MPGVRRLPVIGGITIHSNRGNSIMYKNPQQDKHMSIIELNEEDKKKNSKTKISKFKILSYFISQEEEMKNDHLIDEYIDRYWLLNIPKNESISANN